MELDILNVGAGLQRSYVVKLKKNSEKLIKHLCGFFPHTGAEPWSECYLKQ